MGFATVIATLDYTFWAFESYKTLDNGKQIATVLANGTCEAGWVF